jgi:hypothetical protein
MSGTHSPAPDRAAVPVLFERHRKTPGAPFDESHFVDYLLAQPKQSRAVYNSFSGLRRYKAFVDEVLLKFSICLSIQDRDANYSLEAFVKRLIALQHSRRSSLASLHNQQRRDRECRSRASH